MTLLADRLGPERAAIVIERAGGRRLSVPCDLSHHRAAGCLRRLLGTTIATAVVLHFGGQTIYVPRGVSKYPAKLSAVVRMTRDGKSAAFIAQKLGCSDRTVYTRRAEAKRLGLLPE